MKCIWEQFDNSETEVNPEVYGRLAEDATYKLWELCNVSEVSDWIHNIIDCYDVQF